MRSFFKLFTLRNLGIFIGFFPALFFLVFIAGDGIRHLAAGKTGIIPLLIIVLILISGYILAWRRTFTGGIIMVAGSLIIAAYLGFTGEGPVLNMVLIFSLPFGMPGLLFLSGKRNKV